MKKIANYLFTIILFIFSFYYTNIVSNYIKEKDPIMLALKKSQKTFETDPINAIIDNNTIIPGRNGKIIDLDKSYRKMKKINKFLESLIVFKETPPDISLKNNYDKVIINGNKTSKSISILLKVNDLKILKKLKDNSLNFILDINFIESNQDYLKQISNNIIVLEQPNIANLSNIDYCYIENSFSSYCKNYQLYTIKPIFITHDYYYNTYQLLDNGKIFSYLINEHNIDEIYKIYLAIKNLGYEVVSLDTLLKE